GSGDSRATSGSRRDGARARSTSATPARVPGYASRGTRSRSRSRPRARARSGHATSGAAPPRAGGPPGRWPSVALARDRGQHGLLVDDADDAVVLDGANGAFATHDQRHGAAHRGADVEPRAVVLARARVAHDPAEGEHVATRDVPHEVLDVLVRRRAHELLRRAELHDRAVA